MSRAALAVLSIAVLPLAAAGRAAQRGPNAPQAPRVPDADLEGWLEKRLADLEPRPSERRLDEIGWARDLREAQRLAKESGRPIFLFTHDGRMATGRC